MWKTVIMALNMVIAGMGIGLNHFDGFSGWQTVGGSVIGVAESFTSNPLQVTSLSLYLEGPSTVSFTVIFYRISPTTGEPWGYPMGITSWPSVSIPTSGWHTFTMYPITLVPTESGFAVQIQQTTQVTIAYDNVPDGNLSGIWYSWQNTSSYTSWSKFLTGDWGIQVNSGIPVEPTSLSDIKAIYH